MEQENKLKKRNLDFLKIENIGRHPKCDICGSEATRRVTVKAEGMGQLAKSDYSCGSHLERVLARLKGYAGLEDE